MTMMRVIISEYLASDDDKHFKEKIVNTANSFDVAACAFYIQLNDRQKPLFLSFEPSILPASLAGIL